jgi:cellulose synthase/poly-beta-1,6-N-acetylglucosamine synthase-like glycosyltransferase
MFERRALLQVGCFDADMLTEDAEISYRLYEHGKRILYDDSLSTHDLAPVNFRNFFNQRHRWMQGLWQAMLAHLARRQDRRLSGRLGAYFVQFTFDGFGALCLCWLEALIALSALGLVALPAALVIPVYALLLSSGFALSVGALRSRRPLNLLLLPLLPGYIVLHTIPMAWALVDSYVLKKPLVWVKTERSLSDGLASGAPVRQPEPGSAPLASERA